jgi:hypothetical protein
MKLSGSYVLPEDHAAIIGRISDAWAHLEFQIDRGIWTLLATQHQLAACVTAQLSFIHPRIKAFISLIEIHGGKQDTIDELNKLYGKQISALSEKRNRSVHDPRMVDKDTRAVHRFEATAKGKLSFGFKPEPIDTLETLYNELHEAITKFIELRDRAIREIEAIPAEARPQFVSIVEHRTVQLTRDSEPQENPPQPPPSKG